MEFYVYILWCKQTHRTYVGQTDHLIRRFRLHREGSTKTTRERLSDPVIAYWELLPTRAEAMRRERFFKQGAGHRLKLQLVAQATAWFDPVG